MEYTFSDNVTFFFTKYDDCCCLFKDNSKHC